MRQLLYTIGTIWLLCSNFGMAQTPRYSELDVQRQQKFIEAKQQQLLGNLEEAEKQYLALFKEAPENHAAAFELARIYDEQKKVDKALEYAQKASQLNAENPWYQEFLAESWQASGQYDKAAAVYAGLSQQFPENEAYYDSWAYYLVRSNQPQEAIKVYDQLEKLIGPVGEISLRKHRLYLGLGEEKKAEKALLQLLEQNPDRVEYLHILADFYEQMRNAAKRKEVYQRILALDPMDLKAQAALSPQGPSSNATAFLESLKPVFAEVDVSIDQKIEQLLPAVQEIANTNDQTLTAKALELSRILETTHPGNPKGFSVSGDLYFYSGQMLKAQEKYRQALELDQTVFLVWEHYLYTFSDLEDYTGLVKASERALEVFPNQVSLYYLNGIGYSQEKEYEAAIGSFEEALFMASGNPQMQVELQLRLGSTYHYAGDASASDRAFETALEMAPNNPLVLNNYSYYLAQRGSNLPKALAMAEKANQLKSGDKNFQDTYSWVLYKDGDFKQALQWSDKALKNGGEQDAQILEHRGDILFQLNQADAALQAWQQAQQVGGGSPLLEKKIANKQLYE
ncbi:MAG: tetratricopeptide repeat protein [Bacteroidota bacterium]